MKQKTLSPKAIEFNLSLEGFGFEKVLAGLLARGLCHLRLPIPISLQRNRDSGSGILLPYTVAGQLPFTIRKVFPTGFPFQSVHHMDGWDTTTSML
jgi:hypothetical protein